MPNHKSAEKRMRQNEKPSRSIGAIALGKGSNRNCGQQSSQAAERVQTLYGNRFDYRPGRAKGRDPQEPARATSPGDDERNQATAK